VILVDSSVWVDHFRGGVRHLIALLDEALVLGHPWVRGELALGGLPQGQAFELLGNLPQAERATDDEVLAFIRLHRLSGVGIGHVDAQLLASTVLTDGARLWSRDRALVTAAERLGCVYAP
jgi:predicted nucleic acid-binding protein